MNRTTLILVGTDVRDLLPVRDAIAAVELGFRRVAEGAASAPAVLGFPLAAGGFHVKAAALRLSRWYFAAKLNGNFPGNPPEGLPTIQGVVALCDAENGRLLALVDSSEITRLRTGAATAVAAKYLARPDSTTLTLFGCGFQARAQVESLGEVLPLTRVYASDLLPAAARETTAWIRGTLGVRAEPVSTEEALRNAPGSDIVVTCTPSRQFFLGKTHVSPGTFVAAVGADDIAKQELEPALLANATLVVDVLEQCATIGELHHALDAGVLRREQVHAELADLVSGERPGRRARDEITVFDSTGTALEDVVVTAVVYERALSAGRGLALQLS